jgi:hypothetical protein
MANVQQAAIAAGFLHALRDAGVLAEWQNAKGDSSKLCALIQKTLGLAQTPSAADLAAMRDYAEKNLQSEHAELLEQQPNGPHIVGFSYGAES